MNKNYSATELEYWKFRVGCSYTSYIAGNMPNMQGCKTLKFTATYHPFINPVEKQVKLVGVDYKSEGSFINNKMENIITEITLVVENPLFQRERELLLTSREIGFPRPLEISEKRFFRMIPEEFCEYFKVKNEL